MWSKLITTTPGFIAKSMMDYNQCEYHNWNHVLEMFQYLQDSGTPYDTQLDLAVLYHDVVYDDQPEKEQRSAQFLINQSVSFSQIEISGTVNLIIATADHAIHEYSSWQKKAIIRADLHGLANTDTSLTNYVKILNESVSLYNVTQPDFAVGNRKFMVALRDTCSSNRDLDVPQRKFWSRVLDGIALTETISDTIIKLNIC